MILKAGAYRFNDVLVRADIPSNTLFKGYTITTFDDPVVLGIMYCDNYTAGNTTQNGLFFGGVFSDTLPPVSPILYADANVSGTIYEGWQDGATVDIVSELCGVIGEDTEVDETFGTWYIANTDYNEVNGIVTKPLAEITYNGETIAQLNAGETATLSCEGKKMASDVVVKVNKVESKIPEGYVKPEGSLSITKNGTYPVTDKEEVVVDVPIPDGYVKPEGTLEITLNNIEANPIDCSQYAKVAVNTAEPLRISDPTVLDNITDTPHGLAGNVFLYEGTTTDSYENGAYYLLEDTEK